MERGAHSSKENINMVDFRLIERVVCILNSPKVASALHSKAVRLNLNKDEIWDFLPTWATISVKDSLMLETSWHIQKLLNPAKREDTHAYQFHARSHSLTNSIAISVLFCTFINDTSKPVPDLFGAVSPSVCLTGKG